MVVVDMVHVACVVLVVGMVVVGGLVGRCCYITVIAYLYMGICVKRILFYMENKKTMYKCIICASHREFGS